MRKIYLSLLMMFMGIALSYSQADRFVLVEEFTNAGCGPCASQNPDFNALLNGAGEAVIPIKYQTAGPGYDPNNVINPSPVNTRAGFYEVSGVPTAYVDGQPQGGNAYEGAPANVTSTILSNKGKVETPISIAVTHGFNDDASKVVVNVSIENMSGTDLDATNLRVFAALTEKEMNFPFAPGSNGEREFTDVFRAFVNEGNGNGENLTTIAAGETWTKEYSIDVPFYYDYRQMNAIAFVQNMSSKEILQAGASSTVLEFADVTDIAISKFVNVPNDLCLQSLDMDVLISNEGDVTINTITLDVLNGDDVLFTKTLEDLGLESGSEEVYSLGTIDFNGGSYSLDYTITDVNGGGSRDMNVLNNYDQKIAVATFSEEKVAPLNADLENLESLTTGDFITDKKYELQIGSVTKAFLSQFDGLNPQDDLGAYGDSKSSMLIAYYNWNPSSYPSEAFAAYGKFDVKDFTDPVLIYDRASADYSSGPNNDGYKVQLSDDCGDNWTTVFEISGNAMRTAPAQEAFYLPSKDQWVSDTINIAEFADAEELSFRFLFETAWGNNLFLDNIRVENSTTSVKDFNLHNSLSLYPNPASNYVKLDMEMDQRRDVTLEVYSVTGVMMDRVSYGKNEGSFVLDYNASNLSNGMYLFTIKTDGLERTERVHILK